MQVRQSQARVKLNVRASSKHNSTVLARLRQLAFDLVSHDYESTSRGLWQMHDDLVNHACATKALCTNTFANHNKEKTHCVTTVGLVTTKSNCLLVHKVYALSW